MKLNAKHNLIIEQIRTFFTISDSKPEVFNQNEPANFETAITATGFGKYNLLLLLVAFPSTIACTTPPTTVSFIMPIAECDLNLTLENKGLLNGIAYLGMIISGFFWGYLSDTIGRKKLLIVGYLSNGVFVLLSGFSQHFLMLLILKFLEGFVINGSFSALISYMNEFHCAKYRSILPVPHGIIIGIGGFMLPLLGWLILTKYIEINLFSNLIVLRSWNIFLITCSIPSLTAGFCFMLLPESPKFQMTIGRNDLAYKTFQRIYSWNSGCSVDKYPVKILAIEINCSENADKCKSKMQAIKDGWQQILPLFQTSFVGKMLLVAAIQMFVMMGLNTLRLWLPQLFAVISVYQSKNHNTITAGAGLCEMLNILNPNKNISINTCVVNNNIESAYKNNIIVALATIASFVVVAGLTTRLCGKKITFILSSLISGICGTSLVFGETEVIVVVLSSICVGLGTVATTTMLSIIVDIFPTSFRTMTVAIAMTCGRIGAMTGNVIFPTLLAAGCFTPFATIGCIIIGAAILGLALPKTDRKDLE